MSLAVFFGQASAAVVQKAEAVQKQNLVRQKSSGKKMCIFQNNITSKVHIISRHLIKPLLHFPII